MAKIKGRAFSTQFFLSSALSQHPTSGPLPESASGDTSQTAAVCSMFCLPPDLARVLVKHMALL